MADIMTPALGESVTEATVAKQRITQLERQLRRPPRSAPSAAEQR